MWDLRSLLQHVGSLVMACELLVVACVIYDHDQGSNLGPLHWEYSLSHWTTREILWITICRITSLSSWLVLCKK